MSQPKPRLVLITTSSGTIRGILLDQIRGLLTVGFEVQAISSPDEWIQECRERTGIPIHAVKMHRRLSPLSDMAALLRLWRLLRRLKPAIVHTHTPKAGLLGMMAASLAGTKIRVHTLPGFVSVTKKGWRRFLLNATDQLTFALATEVLCVSHSLRHAAIDSGLCPERKIRTLGHGSNHGVDLTRFDPSIRSGADRLSVRERYGIPAHCLLLGFVGRIVRDKGMEELADAWISLRGEFPDLHLLLCGDFEAQDPISKKSRDIFENDPKVHLTRSFVDDMPAIYAALDISVLPTYREGLPGVVLEAAAMKIPIVATRVTGCVDIIQDGVTGLLVNPGNTQELLAALKTLIRNPELRQKLGESARDRVGLLFEATHVCALLQNEYRRLLDSHGYSS
jgi:glycosyltransferase involved in cell wall biosynthesis